MNTNMKRNTKRIAVIVAFLLLVFLLIFTAAHNIAPHPHTPDEECTLCALGKLMESVLIPLVALPIFTLLIARCAFEAITAAEHVTARNFPLLC